MRKKVIFGILAVAVVVAIVLATQKDSEAPETSSVPGTDLTFIRAKKSAHYESNTPAHASVLPSVPVNVVVDVNFDLAAPSAISVSSNGKEYGIGNTMIDNNTLAMRRAMDPSAPDGLYLVAYRACWPDTSCHDGKFQFVIDRSKAVAAQDLRNQKEVSVSLANLAFSPKVIRISRGTRVIWKNNEAAEHYVNTDSHPAHTYYPKQNSRLLKAGDVYGMVFDTPGVYPYHCSAHAETMTGTVLVE